MKKSTPKRAAKPAAPTTPAAPAPGSTPFAIAHGELVGAARKVLTEIDRLALICDGTNELRAAIARAEAAG